MKLDPEKGYKEARKYLDERLGGVNEQLDDMISELLHGPSLNGENIPALQRLVDALWDATVEMKIQERWPELDNFTMVNNIARRFADKLSERYRSRVVEYRDMHNEDKRPGIEWLKKFLIKEIEKRKGSVYTTSLAKPGGSRGTSSMTQERKNQPYRGRVIGLTTTVEGSEDTSPTHSGQRDVTVRPFSTCPVCLNKGQAMAHTLHACTKFRGMPVAVRRRWVQMLRLCFNCVKANHRADECRTRTPCEVPGCGENHSRWLHMTRPGALCHGTSVKTVKTFPSD